ncbi:MAG TPA: phenylalanine--tRNA ligase beta subunit-related protein, partial [Thermomicrobiales bacterium]|nr:phenylalanine--tRNA ligase beta subunit-related protein [Thermomicrobiales bacterium]
MSETTVLTDDLQTLLDAASIAPGIATRWPDYRALLIVAEGFAPTGDVAYAETFLGETEARIRAMGEVDWGQHPHMAAWNEAYRGFGAKPQRTRPSALALLKRVGGGLPRIDPATDLYNAISVGHVLPIGGEDIAGYEGPPRLVSATGDEPFETTDSGEAVIDHPAAGEVVWRDDRGVTCRRWNWRQGTRTRITPET